VLLRSDQLALLDWLYSNGEVTQRVDHEDGSVTLSLRVTDAASKEINDRLRSNIKG